MISSNVRNDRICYMLGATREGRRRHRRGSSQWVSCIDYVFIDGDKAVRASLLLNPVLDNPLDLIIHCYCDGGDTGPATPSFRSHQYLHEDAVTYWAHSAAGHMGNVHYRAPYIPPKFDYGNTNRSAYHQDGYVLCVSLPGSSGS